MRPLFAVCVCVCLSRGSIVRPGPYVYAVCLHLSQGAPAGVVSDNA